MEYTHLPQSYYTKQLQRVSAVREKIASRDAIVTDGRVIPEDGEMPIGIGKRFNAAVMFLDICDFSQRPSDSEIEQSNNLRLLSFFFSEMIRIIEDYGGFVEKNTGDGLMAYFTEDNSTSNTARQKAVAAAMSMFYAGANLLNPVILLSNLPAINFRISLDYGNITVAEVGASRRFRGVVAIGSTANFASKMLKFATKNSIVLGLDMLNGLPRLWLEHVSLKELNTGWLRGDNPYPLYEFTGRWSQPLQI